MNSRLGSSPSRLHTSSSSLSLVIFTYQYVLWINASQPITYLELQGKLPSSQLLQNHSRRTHCQVWLSRVTRQDLQPSSHNSGIMMTCWCQSSVIYSMTWEGAPLSSSQQLWPVPMRSWALVIKQGWRLHKGGVNSFASNRLLRLHAIQWCSRIDNLISSTNRQSTDSFHSRKYLPTA